MSDETDDVDIETEFAGLIRDLDERAEAERQVAVSAHYLERARVKRARRMARNLRDAKFRQRGKS